MWSLTKGLNVRSENYVDCNAHFGVFVAAVIIINMHSGVFGNLLKLPLTPFPSKKVGKALEE